MRCWKQHAVGSWEGQDAAVLGAPAEVRGRPGVFRLLLVGPVGRVGPACGGDELGGRATCVPRPGCMGGDRPPRAHAPLPLRGDDCGRPFEEALYFLEVPAARCSGTSPCPQWHAGGSWGSAEPRSHGSFLTRYLKQSLRPRGWRCHKPQGTGIWASAPAGKCGGQVRRAAALAQVGSPATRSPEAVAFVCNGSWHCPGEKKLN